MLSHIARHFGPTLRMQTSSSSQYHLDCFTIQSNCSTPLSKVSSSRMLLGCWFYSSTQGSSCRIIILTRLVVESFKSEFPRPSCHAHSFQYRWCKGLDHSYIYFLTDRTAIPVLLQKLFLLNELRKLLFPPHLPWEAPSAIETDTGTSLCGSRR